MQLVPWNESGPASLSCSHSFWLILQTTWFLKYLRIHIGSLSFSHTSHPTLKKKTTTKINKTKLLCIPYPVPPFSEIFSCNTCVLFMPDFLAHAIKCREQAAVWEKVSCKGDFISHKMTSKARRKSPASILEVLDRLFFMCAEVVIFFFTQIKPNKNQTMPPCYYYLP